MSRNYILCTICESLIDCSSRNKLDKLNKYLWYLFQKLPKSIFHFLTTIIAVSFHSYSFPGQSSFTSGLCSPCNLDILISYIDIITFMHIFQQQKIWWLDGLAPDCSFSIANTLEILQSCTEPSMCSTVFRCDQTALQMVFSVCLSVRLSVCPSVRHTFLTMFPSSDHHEIFRSYYQWPT